MSVYAPLPKLAPHTVVFVSADGTSICPIAQAKSKESTLPPPPLPHQYIPWLCSEKTPRICPLLSVLNPTTTLHGSPGPLPRLGMSFSAPTLPASIYSSHPFKYLSEVIALFCSVHTLASSKVL